MSKNLSISNSENPKRFCVIVCGFFLFTFFLSVLLFALFPQAFFWRAWEYFDEIIFSPHYVGPKRWNGYEKGSLSRQYLFSFQEKWKTFVTVDDAGYRSVPFKADRYPILVTGDSQIWGCGLNDDETLPWKLAQKLQLPVYNGGRTRFSLENLLANDTLKHASYVIEVVSYHDLHPNTFPDGFTIETYQTLKAKASHSSKLLAHFQLFCSVFFKDPQRYFLPFKICRFLTLDHLAATFLGQKELNDWGVALKGYTSILSGVEISLLAEKIEKRSYDLKKLGYSYVFVLLPPKALVCSEDPSKQMIDNAQKLFQLLKFKGVDAIDLTSSFCAHENRKCLYLRTDVHWSPKGTEVASDIIVAHLSERFPDFAAKGLDAKGISDKGN